MQRLTKLFPPRRSKPILYPFLFGMYSILALMSENAGKVALSDVVRSTVIVLAALSGLFVLVWLLFRNPERAGLVCLLEGFLFFSFGHIYSLAPQLPLNVFLAFWSVLAILGTWWLLRIVKAPWRYTQALNVFTIILVVLPGVNIAFRAVQNAQNVVQVGSPPPSGGSLQMAAAQNAQGARPPDIYYLILDGYGREDVLRDLYDYDNSAFIQGLQARGFYVAGQSHSNYTSTLLSLSSSLNLNYLDLSALEFRPGSPNIGALVPLISHSYVRSFLEERGYQTVALSNNYTVSSADSADLVISNGGLNNFEHRLVETTLASLVGFQLYADATRQAIHNSLERPAALHDPNTPRFIFIHVISPHPPFLFGPNGEELPFTGYVGDGSTFFGGPQNYIPLYTGQMTYLNRLVLTLVDQLQADPNYRPVIIIQGDHGPAAYLDAPGGPCVRERTSILNAYYLPDAAPAQLYDSITPVNTFRVVFNAYFGTQLDLLGDRTYLSPAEDAYETEEVTSRLDECKR